MKGSDVDNCDRKAAELFQAVRVLEAWVDKYDQFFRILMRNPFFGSAPEFQNLKREMDKETGTR